MSVSRRLWNWHEDAALAAWVARPAGRLALWLAALLLLRADTKILVGSLLALFCVWPARRREILSLGSLWFAFAFARSRLGGGTALEIALWVGAQLGIVYLAYRAARHFDRLPARMRDRPVLATHLVVAPLLAAVWLLAAPGPPRQTLAWQLARGAFAILPFLVWRLTYMMLSGKRGSARETRFVDHLFYCLPAFGGTSVPYGKGLDYLRQRQAVEAVDLARSQLAGLKLLALAMLWSIAQVWLAVGLHAEPAAGYGSGLVDGLGPAIPRLRALIAGTAEAPLAVSWASLLLELVDRTLRLAAFGHTIVGALRLFGFNVFRNTYKPLLAESIVEFWNRFYYYFKELLVEHFFFPTYVRYFKRSPALRMLAAVMAAAFVGNVFFHVLRDAGILLSMGPADAWGRLAPRVLYAFLLGCGVFVSMQRQQALRGRSAGRGGPPTRRVRLRRVAGVWLFFSLIHVWNVAPVRLSFGQRREFLASLFGLG